MKLEEDCENIAREIRVLKKIENIERRPSQEKGAVSHVIDYGFLGLKSFSGNMDDQDEIKSFGFYVMPLYDVNLRQYLMSKSCYNKGDRINIVIKACA